MTSRALTLSLAVALVLVSTSAGVSSAGGPERDGGSFTETFYDDFILELCGIETLTTMTQRWSVKRFEDGSEIVHVTRTFVSEDPRIPIEKGDGNAFIAPDGTRTVVGLPLLLIGDRGTIVVAAGRTVFADDVTVRGTDPDLSDLAVYYCP